MATLDIETTSIAPMLQAFFIFFPNIISLQHVLHIGIGRSLSFLIAHRAKMTIAIPIEKVLPYFLIFMLLYITVTEITNFRKILHKAKIDNSSEIHPE